MNRPFANRAEDEFMDALDGRPASPTAIELARFAGALRESAGADAADPIRFATGRMRLLQVVELRREEKRRAGVGRFKGAAMSLAAVAGGGLVVAGAASGSNPVTLAVDMARDFSGPAVFAPAPGREYSFVAEVVASDEGTLEVLLEGRTIRVEPPTPLQGESAREDKRLPAFEPGTSVRVTGREPATDNVTATKIEVVPNAAKPLASPAAANLGTRTGTAPAAVATNPAGVNKTATPLKDSGAAIATRTPTPKPTPPLTPTPKPTLTSVVVPTAVAEPNETPVVAPDTVAPASIEDDQSAPRPDPKVTAK